MKSVITFLAVIVAASGAIQQNSPFSFQRRPATQPSRSAFSAFSARPAFSRPSSPFSSPTRYGVGTSGSQYAPVNSAAYNYQSASASSDEGQYNADNSGAYNPNEAPDNSGAYTPQRLNNEASDNSGAYNPQRFYNGASDNSGAYNPQYGGSNYQRTYPSRYADSGEGQYSGDNTGSYYHADGGYIHDNSGVYIHDNSGDYIHIHNPYEHLDQPYVHKGGEYIHPRNYVSIPPAGGYGPPVALQRGNAAGLYDNRNYKIIRKIEHVGDDLYDYLYETENGIYAEEDGKIGNKGKKEEAVRAKGYYTYTGPDSNIYTVNYTADENGFLPDAAHIPTPPPLPEAIQRSLAYQRSIGELE